jgi:DNA/RNA endonuclease YhcR with UshA esterase domain
MRKILLGVSLLVASLGVQAQWSITSTGATGDTITFDQSFTGVNTGVFAGTGLTGASASGELNSNAWKFLGFSDGNTTFGGSFTTGDYAKGPSAGGVTSGGLYSFEVAAGDSAIGIQPTASDWSPGSIVLMAINNTGGSVDSFLISYDVFVLNNEARGSSFNFSYSINDSVNFTPVTVLNDTSDETASTTPTWVATQKQATVAASMNAGDTLYLVWSGDDALGSGGRDEFALDNIAVELMVPGLAQIDLPITWDDTANVDYTTVAFGGGLSAPDLDPTNSSNNVLRFVKPLGAQPWAGVTLSTTNGLANTIPFTPAANTVSAKVYSPVIGTTLMLKTEVVGSPTVFVEASVTTTVANAWETVVFDFANPSNGTINYSNNYSLLSFFPDFQSTAAGDTFYVDSVYFGGTPVIPVVIPTYDIATITTQDPANGEPDSNGVFCWTKGVVMGIDLDGNAGYSFTIWDNDGINIYNSADVSGYVVTEGDSIMVRGTVGQFNGLTQFSPDSIILVNQGNTIPSPTVVSSLSEMYESELVRIENFYVIDNPVNSGSFNVTLSNGSDTVSMRVDSDTDIDGNVIFALGDTICYIVGIGGQFDNSSPYTSGYQLFPQRASDIDNSCGGILPPPVPYYPIKDINNVDANGEPDSLGVYCWTKGVVLGIDLDGNAGISFTIYDEEGINVFNFADVSNYVVTEGDSIEVRGSILFFNGLTEITPDSIRLISAGNTVPAPKTYTSLSEETESAPIRVVNVMVINPAQWGTGNSSFNVDLVTCSGDTIVMRADSDTDIGDVITSAPAGMFTVKGVGGQFDGSSPYLSGYQIFPMSALDIDTTTDYSAPSFFVNEIMSDNDAVIADASGEFDDWAELYNAGTSDVMLAGMFFTDDAAEPMKYQVPSNSTEMLPAGGYALVWCDGESEQGDLHTNFSLSASGEYFGVTSYDGCAMVDGFDFPALATDASFGRITDGADSLVSFPTWSTTPNAMNVLDTVNSVGEFGFEATQLVVYPNPTAANATVRFNEKITFEVYDVLGNRVASARNTNEFAVANLASGAYLIRTNNGEVIRMIVK